MNVREQRVAVPGGDLAVVDFGGDGPDVLLIHSVSHASVVWEQVAAALTPSAHVVAFDLRGHGQSSAEAQSVDQIPDDIVSLIGELGLGRPVLVGHDVAGGFAAAVAAEHPELVAGVVVIDSSVVESQADVLEMVQAVGADVIVDMLTQRFRLGATGADEDSLETFLDEQSGPAAQDWLAAAPDAASIRALLRRCIVVAPDGSWVYRPTPDTLRALTRQPEAARFRPGRELLAAIDAPVTVVTLSEGRNGSGGDGLHELAAGRPALRIARRAGGPHCLYLEPSWIAAEIRTTLSDRA